MPAPFVSCVMPTYNRRRFIPQALRCFANRTYRNTELIVVDDSERSMRSLCEGVEGMLDKNPIRAVGLMDALRQKQIAIRNIRPAHYAVVKRLVDFQLIARSRLRFAHDALFGVGAGCFDELLAGTRCRITTLNAAHNPFFGGLNPDVLGRSFASPS